MTNHGIEQTPFRASADRSTERQQGVESATNRQGGQTEARKDWNCLFRVNQSHVELRLDAYVIIVLNVALKQEQLP